MKNPCSPSSLSGSPLTLGTGCPDPGQPPGSPCGDALWQMLAGQAHLVDGSGCHDGCNPGASLQSAAARHALAAMGVPDGCYFWKACVPDDSGDN